MLTEKEREAISKTLDAYCEARIPLMVRDQVVLQYRIYRHDVVLFEKRPVFDDPTKWIEAGVAKFRLNKSAGTWTLFCQDRNSRWHSYGLCGPAEDFATLLKEVDEDPSGIFWG